MDPGSNAKSSFGRAEDNFLASRKLNDVKNSSEVTVTILGPKDLEKKDNKRDRIKLSTSGVTSGVGLSSLRGMNDKNYLCGARLCWWNLNGTVRKVAARRSASRLQFFQKKCPADVGQSAMP